MATTTFEDRLWRCDFCGDSTVIRSAKELSGDCIYLPDGWDTVWHWKDGSNESIRLDRCENCKRLKTGYSKAAVNNRSRKFNERYAIRR